jgi:hypothetical protein
MNIEELTDKSYDLCIDIRVEEIDHKAVTKLSIEFAISVLEEIVKSYKEDIEQETRTLSEWSLGYRGCSLDTIDGLNCKIQELKTYLDEKERRNVR